MRRLLGLNEVYPVNVGVCVPATTLEVVTILLNLCRVSWKNEMPEFWREEGHVISLSFLDTACAFVTLQHNQRTKAKQNRYFECWSCDE